MLGRFIHTFWGDFTKDELTKFLYLTLGAFLLIGAQWPGKLLKDGILVGELGAALQPKLKILVTVVTFPLTLAYAFLVTKLRRESVIYAVVGFLTLIGLVFYAGLSMFFAGLPMPVSKNILIGGYYLYADIFTALTIPAFWAFVNDVTTPSEAKKGYGLIVFGAQFGGLVTTWVAGRMSTSIESGPLISLMSTVLLLIFGLCIWSLVHKVKRSSIKGYSDDKNKKVEEKHSVPFLSGLFLIAASPYVAGIFFLTGAQEVINSIMVYTILSSVGASITSKAEIVKFMFDYGLVIQIVACLFSLIGTSYFQRRFGIRTCLMGYPILLIFCMAAIKFNITLWGVAIVTALAKGLHYSLNKPVREILYIPTTRDVKYKSKAWTEMFGTRGFKAMGSWVNMLGAVPAGVIAIGLPVVWAVVAKFVGQKYHDSVKKDEIVV